MTIDVLGATASSLAEPLGSATRAEALRRWATSAPRRSVPTRLPGVAASTLAALRDRLWFPSWEVRTVDESTDGTTKWAIALGGGATVETVLIPGAGRATVCVSSQSGCTRKCAFCATATLGFNRNLKAGEIVLQYVVAAEAARARGLDPRNVVFMGMGEPLDNLDEVLAAVESLTDVFPGLSPKRVTVSTSGIAPKIPTFLKRSRASLALSLNATTDEVRTRIMPHNKTWPLQAIFDALRTTPRRVFIEYVHLPGVNDFADDAVRLGRLLEGLDVHVNVIPHNPFETSVFRAPSRDETLRFHAMVKAQGLKGIVRWPRGREIAGACGQLALRTKAA